MISMEGKCAMGHFQKIIVLLLCAALMLPFFSGCGQKASTTIALMPLDSRPCNTQYPALLAEASATTLLEPPQSMMDSFLEEADTAALWQWLETDAATADHVVIFTNSLFCGGLIASRSSGAYDDVDASLARLEDFCRDYKAQEGRSITVVQVLPRLKPNQYDSALFPYVDALTAYGKVWDAADAAGNAAPESADGVPAEVLSEYRALQEESAELAKSLNEMAEDGLIDQLLISQDDGDAQCPANITFRALAEAASENTRCIHGADELAMLLVSDLAAGDMAATPVQVVYSGDSDKHRLYPYESISLEEITSQKLALGGLTQDDAAETTLYLHTDSSDAAATKETIAHHDGWLGLADVAQTNQADTALSDTLLAAESLSQINAYAGWNTADNSVGTVCAELRTQATLAERWNVLSEEARTQSVQALLCFRAVRLGEDVGYMAGLRESLPDAIYAAGLSDDNAAFLDDAAHERANAMLSDAYAPFGASLAALFDGEHALLLANRSVNVSISDFSASATFPWARSFEVKIAPEMTVTIDEP